MDKKIGLFFGTFNPIHIGHIIVANHFVEFTDIDEVWFVVTPKSPDKVKKSLLPDHQRYDMVYMATEKFYKLKPSRIEFNLPQPNYTVDTLAYLEEKHPDKNFVLLMGEDNLNSLHRWKNYEVLLENYEIYVYPRVSDNTEELLLKDHPKIIRVNAPIIQISSSFIRKAIKDNKNVTPLLPQKVWEYIDDMLLYR